MVDDLDDLAPSSCGFSGVPVRALLLAVGMESLSDPSGVGGEDTDSSGEIKVGVGEVASNWSGKYSTFPMCSYAGVCRSRRLLDRSVPG